jgi:hypothetical protein
VSTGKKNQASKSENNLFAVFYHEDGSMQVVG